MARTSPYFVLILICLWQGSVFAQYPFNSPTTVTDYPFANPLLMNKTMGLSSDRIIAIAEDESGFAWIGTDFGLNRFDGTKVKTFVHQDNDSTTIMSNYVLDIFPDPGNGVMWVGTTKGISAFDPQSQTFKNYYHDPKNPNSPFERSAYHIYKDSQGDIWIAFKRGGILKYRPKTDDFQRFLCLEDVNKDNPEACEFSAVWIDEDPQQNNILWIATADGLTRFDKKTGQGHNYINDAQQVNVFREANNLRSVMAHPNGLIYFGTWWEDCFTFDPKTERFTKLLPQTNKEDHPFHRDVIISFYPISEHEFWINSLNGLRRYDTRSKKVTQSFVNNKKMYYSVDHVDPYGRIWSGSRGQGFRIFNPLLQQYRYEDYDDPDSEFNNNPGRILEDTLRKKLYVVAEISKGLFVKDQLTGKWQIIPPPKTKDEGENQAFRSVDVAFLENGELLISAKENLYWYRPGDKVLRLYPLQPKRKSPELRAIVPVSKDQYWIYSYYGPYILDIKENTLTHTAEKLKAVSGGLLGGSYANVDTKGNLWFQEHNGLLIYANDKFIYHPYDPQDIKAFRGMARIEPDAYGGMWIATKREFLGYAHADSIEKGVLRWFGKKDGLEGNAIRFVKAYKDKLIVTSDLGFQVFDPKTFEFGPLHDLNYGLKGRIDKLTILSSGEVVAKQGKQLVYFRPEELQKNKEKPIPYITAFNIFDKSFDINRETSPKAPLHLSYKQNFFSFEFSAINFNLPEKTKFRYKLEGFNKDWQDGYRKFASYTNVPGGNYRFLIEAVNNEGLVGKSQSITHLYISTIWYKTTWFWVLASMLILGLVYATIRYRIQQVRSEERLKSSYERKLADMEMSALRAQMNPHFIFNSLNSIEYYIISNEAEKASDYLNRFSRLIRLILQNSKSQTISLKDDLEALKLYIEMESLRYDNLFEYEVKTEKQLDLNSIEVPPMLMQPYVENAIWHGLMQKKDNKGKLELHVHRQNGNLICSIEDNGIGREAAMQLKSKTGTKRKSYGMKITKDRINMLNSLGGGNASVEVIDLKKPDGSAAGTRVELVIPILENKLPVQSQ